MSFSFASVHDTSNAYTSSLTAVSPNSRWIVCNDFAGNTSLSDASGTPSLIWNAALSYSDGGFGTAEIVVDAVDDAGDVWGKTGFADYKLMKVPKSDHVPVASYTWSVTGTPEPENAYVDKIFTFTMPDTSIYIVVLIQGITNTTHYYTATKGTGSTLTEHIATFSPAYAFQDKNGDVWIAGMPTSSSLKLLRITDVASSAYPNTVLTYTIPDYTNGSGSAFTPAEIAGAVQADNFVAAWPAQGTSGGTFNQYLLQVPLAGGSVTSTDISSNSIIFPMVSTSNADFKQPFAANLGTLYVQKESALLDNFDGDIFAVGRTFTALNLVTVTFGTEYNLDAWGAGDTGDGTHPSQVESNVYLPSINAFAGTRDQETSCDLFVYYLTGISAPPTSRAFGFSLDGHDFYVLRLGETASLVFDRMTRQWSEWTSPNLDYLRVSCGTNWQGMTTSLADGGTDVVLGDDTIGVLYRMDPLQGRDDNPISGDAAFTRIVTGSIPVDGRQSIPCDAVQITLSLGNPSQLGAAFTLEISDDLGQNWTNCGTVTTVAGNYSEVVEWRALGQMRQPGRLFRFSDDGAAVRIGRAQLR